MRGLWRIYADDNDARETLLSEGRLTLRGKSIPLYGMNPGNLLPGDGDYIRVRVKNIPLSADDGQIKRSINLHGCHVLNLYRERLRYQGRLTNCETGDRILFVSELDGNLPRTMQIGKYKAIVIHWGQPDDRKECSKCMQKGHNTRDCTNEVVCRSCHASGHISSECPIPLHEDLSETEPSDEESEHEEEGAVEASEPSEPSVPVNDEQSKDEELSSTPSQQQSNDQVTKTSKTKSSNLKKNAKSTLHQYFADKSTPQRKSSNIPPHVRTPPTPTEQIQCASGKKPKEHKSKTK